MTRWLNLFAFCLVLTPALGTRKSHAAAPIDYNRQVRPILSENCYGCHGPDEKKRKAGLRLDQKDSAFGELKSGEHALVAGDLEKSALAKRIISKDPEEIMPPAKSGKKLSSEQVDILREWIKQGAVWKGHWAYIAPERPALPEVQDKKWARNEIDYFTLARLEKEGLKPSPEADKTALARRATLDLTGLPPTIEEVDSFLADKNDDAYEHLVDRLLSTAQYGERMALNWLDLARYADTSGYHFDGFRYMWIWRDWVINAFNKNMPFDEFTVEQLAGDLLPNATLEQKIATGFHRNVMTNDEGGADPAEYLNEYLVDRVSTTGVVWLGTTIGCSQCHDHKYDPIKQKEFYQLYAFFHNVPEKGLDGTRVENPMPRLSVPSPQQASDLLEFDKSLADAESALKARESELPKAQGEWEKALLAQGPTATPNQGLAAWFPFDESTAGLNNFGEVIDGSAKGDPAFANGRIRKALNLDGKAQFVAAGQAVHFERTNSFSYGGWLFYRENKGAILSKMKDEDNYRGFDFLLMDGAFEVHIVSKWPDDSIKVRTKATFPKERWLHVFATYDGSSKASGVKIYVNGQDQPLDTQNDKLKGSLLTDVPLHIGKRSSSFFFNGLLDDVRIYERVVSPQEVRALAMSGYWPIISSAPDKRTPQQNDDLKAFFRESFAEDFHKAEQTLAGVKNARSEVIKRIPNTMVMQEMEKPRDTFLLVRGNFQNKGEKVTPDVPKCWPPLPEGMPANRLALARWLVAKDHPLTSRVTVNRYWAMFFGTGIVKTVNDFGSQGEWPSHPELLDWLACQFRDGGGMNHAKPWDLKTLVRMFVTSSTYRQDAAVTPRMLERDPYNRLLTRGPRLRLEAELIRDNALAISGLLNKKIGGESVKPYQPPGIWDGTDHKYEQSHGDDLYRRGMYVFWKRAAHYPSFMTFDAPSREICTALRPRTSTPLQSFVLMNDPVYVEAARAFALRMIQEGGKDPDDRLTFAFRTALARRPSAQELNVLTHTLDEMLQAYQHDEAGVNGLLKVGESPVPEKVNKIELAAYTCVANVLLNLNETVCK